MTRRIIEGPRVKVALFGRGYGEEHILGYRRREDVEIAAVCSKRQESADEVARKYGIPLATTSYDEALSALGLMAVSITSPPITHHEITLAAIERGLHVLCEKPLARSASEAAAMLKAARAAGIVHATNYDFRVVPNIAKFHRLVGEGYVGELRHASMQWMGSYHADPALHWTWRNSREEAGVGVLGDLSHAIDDLLWHFGPIVRIVGNVQTLIQERPTQEGGTRKNDADDAASFIALREDGKQIIGQLSRCAVHGNYRFIECFGSRGMLKMTMPDALNRWCTTLIGARFEDGGPHDLSDPTPSELVESVQERFVKAILDPDVRVITSFEEGYAAMVVTEALLESSATRRWVDIDLNV